MQRNVENVFYRDFTSTLNGNCLGLVYDQKEGNFIGGI